MSNQFSSTSRKGDFQEALKGAIQIALTTLPTDAIHWRLIGMDGISGGVAGQNDLRVTIEANPPANN